MSAEPVAPAGTLCVVVTRPAGQAERAVRELQASGLQAVALPLLRIEPDPQAAARLVAEWSALAARQFVMFVSAAAVEAFFAGAAGRPWPDAVRAGSTGPGTTAALRHAGVPAELIDAPAADAPQFDTEALWARLAARRWSDASVLLVRGEGGRDWLADQLAAQGAQVRFVEAYRRSVPVLSGDEPMRLQQARDDAAHTVWLFSSSQAVQHLRRLAPDADWSRARAWATHARIAQAAQAAGFGEVQVIAPTVEAVVAAWTRALQSPPMSAQRR